MKCEVNNDFKVNHKYILYIYIIIWDSLRENGPSLYNFKVIKMTHV